jgi:GxxExxY protein
MEENEIAKIVVDSSYQIHSRLGPGLYESVYEELLSYELFQRGLSLERQAPIPLIYKGKTFPLVFRADIIVEEKIIIEIKSVESLGPVHYKQLLTYLRITGLKLGLLINFNESMIKQGTHRVANNL